MMGVNTLRGPVPVPIESDRVTCWSCGTSVRDRDIRSRGPRDRRPVCRRCYVMGLDGVWMNCRICGVAQHRRHPGQAEYLCSRCKAVAS